MLMIVAPFMGLELVDPAVPLLTQLTVERLAGFTGRLCLRRLSEYDNYLEQRGSKQ